MGVSSNFCSILGFRELKQTEKYGVTWNKTRLLVIRNTNATTEITFIQIKPVYTVYPMMTRCSLRNEQSIRQQSLNKCSFQAGNKTTRPYCSLCPSARTDHQLLGLASTARKMNEKPCTFSQIVRFPGASHSVYGNVRTGNFHTDTVHNNK